MLELSGRICVALLEEDNPQKSYYRIKPLIVSEGDGYVKCEGMAEAFPEDGAIRIVPDKNESARFKARMRSLGRYCVADLRAHSEENAKIRSNKNYIPGGFEPNANIIYSDVIEALAEGAIAEVVAGAPEGDAFEMTGERPGTDYVAFEGSDFLWRYDETDVPDRYAFIKTDKALDDGFELFEGEKGLRFWITKPGRVLAGSAPESAQPRETREEIPQKPWIHHDESVVPRPVNPKLSPYEQVIDQQRGINPRRGRSIKEIIDEKWRVSRCDRLGVSPDEVSTGKPVNNPVDNAYSALMSAWENSAMRQGIISAVARIDGFGEAVSKVLFRAEEEKSEAELEELNRKKETVVGELAEAKREFERFRGETEKKVREELAGEIEKHNERIKELESREEDVIKRAESAKELAENAEKQIGALTDDKLTARLTEYALNTRAGAVFTGLISGKEVAEPVPEEIINSISLEEMAARLMDAFADEGVTLTRDIAVCYLAAAAIGDVMFTGAVGSGKTARANAFARALGRDRGELKVCVEDDVNAPGAVQKLPCGDKKTFLTAQDNGTGDMLDLRLIDRVFMFRCGMPRDMSEWECCDRQRRRFAGAVSDGALRGMFELSELSPQVKTAMANVRGELYKGGVELTPRALNDIYRFCAYVTPHVDMVAMEVFDIAFMTRAMPYVIATAQPALLRSMNRVLIGMSRSLGLLRQPLPLIEQ